jgi:hypothetical protein
MLETQGWHLIDAELATSEQPAVSGDHIAITIDQDRDIETKNSDAFGNLPDLFPPLSSAPPPGGGITRGMRGTWPISVASRAISSNH